jgi:hypothetical protein
MQGWHTTFLGMRGLPRDISDFEMKAFFTFDGAERDAINARRGDSHKLGLALHIGFLRMSGRLLGAFRVIPVALWRHLGNELGIAAPEVASLRAMYERGRTLFDLTLPLFRVVLSPTVTRPFCAVPRTSVARTASG